MGGTQKGGEVKMNFEKTTILTAVGAFGARIV